MVYHIASKLRSSVLVAKVIVAIALTALSCGAEDVPPEVQERRDLVERIASWDKIEIDSRTVVVLIPCGTRLGSILDPDEYAAIAHTVDYGYEWHHNTTHAIWDLDSTAYANVGGDWGFIGVMDSGGDADGIARLEAIADGEEESWRIANQSLSRERCPFYLQATGDYAGVGDIPMSAADSPVFVSENGYLRTIDRPIITGATRSLYNSNVLSGLGISEANERRSVELWFGDRESSVVVATRGRVSEAEATPFLKSNGYERRVQGQIAYFANEALSGEDAYRRFIYLGSPSKDKSIFSAHEARLIETASLIAKNRKTHLVMSPLGIVAHTAARNKIDALGAHVLLTPRAAGAQHNVEWGAASLGYGRNDSSTGVLVIGMYFEDVDGAREWAKTLPDRLRRLESNEESQVTGVPKRPFAEWCESLTTRVETNVDGSVLAVTCALRGDGPSPPWTALVTSKDLEFLWNLS